MSKIQKQTTVAVFCASSDGTGYDYKSSVYNLGLALGANKNHVYYGGGQNGLMGQLMNGVTTENALMTALIPKVYYNENAKFHPNIDVIPCPSAIQRLESFMKCDFQIAAPGGLGTMGEWGIAMTKTVDATYGDNPMVAPMIFFNPNGLRGNNIKLPPMFCGGV